MTFSSLCLRVLADDRPDQVLEKDRFSRETSTDQQSVASHYQTDIRFREHRDTSNGFDMLSQLTNPVS